ncbi:MAG: DUF6755 family protein [Acidobacteriota bacterium]
MTKPDKTMPAVNKYFADDAPTARRVYTRGRTAVWQARLVLLVMINIAQLWILSATIEAALAGHFKQLVPLVIASGLCWLIALSIFLWWKPVKQRKRSNRSTH